MNRILLHLTDTCTCRRARALAEQAAEVAEHIESLAGKGIVDVCASTAGAVMDAEEPLLQVFVSSAHDSTSDLDSADELVAALLRERASQFLAAADRLDGGAA